MTTKAQPKPGTAVSHPVAEITQRLRAAYPDAHCELNYKTPIQLLVATILSAQCTDKRVNRVTPDLFNKYPTAMDFAAADRTELETAVFLPNMETAVSFLMDGQPMIGEQVAVFGQGIVGLLTTALLAQLPLSSLVTLDRYPLRREWSRKLGATANLDPSAPDSLTGVKSLLQGERPYAGADLTYELSGNPQALDMAIEATGYNGRVLIGSWYGQKRANLNLGGRFHRSHIKLISSQVSRIAPQWNGRWAKSRRRQLAWEMLARHRPDQLVTHRFPIGEAPQAYQLLDRTPEQVIQALLTYD